EFVVLLQGLELADEYHWMLDRLLKAISQPMDILGNQCSVGASIGVTLFPVCSRDSDTLLRQADQAMYAAKKAGKNQYKLYS
ncbi:MAG: diguanylate cyclase domain-containing protein, partial [Methylomonas sp.]